jgi:hypothetical protein
MGQVISTDNAPEDGRGQRLLGLWDSVATTFAVIHALQSRVASGKTIAALPVLPDCNEAQTHDGDTVTAAGLKQGVDGEADTGVDARGINYVTAFVNVGGLDEGESVTILLWNRRTAGGDDYSPAEEVAPGLGNDGDTHGTVVRFEVHTPYFMLEPRVVGGDGSGAATISVRLFLQRK